MGSSETQQDELYQAYRSLEETNHLIRTFDRIGQAVISTLDVREVLHLLAEQVVRTGIFRSLMIALVEEGKNTVVVTEALTRVQGQTEIRTNQGSLGATYSLDDGNVTAEVARTGKLQIIQGWDDRFDLRFSSPERHSNQVSYFLPIKDNDRVLAVLATASSISERREAIRRLRAMRPLLSLVAIALGHAKLFDRLQNSERALREERDRTKRYIDLAQVIFVVLDAAGRIALINRMGCDAIGYDEDELVGASWFDTVIGDEDRERLRKVFDQLMQGETEPVEYYESSMPIRGGGKLEVAWHNTVVRDRGGAVIGTISAGEDVTERRKLEDQLRQSHKMEAIGTLAGGIAHDFNNLLAAIMGYSELLLERPEIDEIVRSTVGDIKRAAERAAEFTRKLLAFGRKQVLELQAIDINEAIDGTGRMLERIIGEDIELTCDLRSGPERLYADPAQLEQVVMNLVANARDAMPRGGHLAIRTEIAKLVEGGSAPIPGMEPGTYILLSVQDDGIGMDEATRARIFEPFFTTKELGRGTGLGLSTVYGIVRQLDGHITVESAVGQGSTFSMYLPAIAEADANRQRQEAGDIIPHGTETVLLVEDDGMVRGMTTKMLRRLGYQVVDCPDAKTAIRRFGIKGGDEFDLMITDVVMPDQGGTALAEDLRKDHPDLKVLFISGYPEDVILRHGIAERPVALLQKPFRMEALARKIRALLDGS